jgi:type II secretory pathway component PulJ
LASTLSEEIARWFENTQRLVERFAEAAQQQDQLKALVAALERDNEQLRREVEDFVPSGRALPRSFALLRTI